MSRVLIAGAAGFIGSWLTLELTKEHEVLGVDDLSSGNINNLIIDGQLPGNLQFRRIDLRHAEIADRVIGEFKPEIIYHLAANAREGASFFQPVSVVSRNVSAYVNTLTSGIKYGMRRMVVFSSIAAYGNQRPPFSEKLELKPVDVYGLSKKMMEDITVMQAECHGFEYVILRPFNVYGPKQALNDNKRNVLAIWMNKIMRNEPLPVFGDGLQLRAFSYIEDNLPAFVAAMTAHNKGVYNVGSSLPVSVSAALAIVLEAMEKEANYPRFYLKERHKEVKFAYTDNTLAKSVLGFVDKTAIEEGIAKMAEWAKKQGPQQWKEGDSLELTGQRVPEVWL